MYLSWLTVAVAFVGIVFLSYSVFRRPQYRNLYLLGILGSSCALYLVKVSITPDQVWAMRRLLPSIMPLLLVVAVVLFERMLRWRPGSAPARAAVGLLGGVIALAPLLSWNGLATSVEYDGDYALAKTLCGVSSGHRVVLVGEQFLPTMYLACDGEAVAFTSSPTASELASVNEGFGGDGSLLLISTTAEGIPWNGAPGAFYSAVTTRWENTLNRVPSATVGDEVSLYVGTVRSDGSVDPAVR